MSSLTDQSPSSQPDPNEKASEPLSVRVDHGAATPSSAMHDSHVRGRRMVSQENARAVAEAETPPWDNGLAWGGLTVASRCATAHFCIVGAPGSGKTMLMRLLMQSALQPIGRQAKTKDFTRVVAIPPRSSASPARDKYFVGSYYAEAATAEPRGFFENIYIWSATSLALLAGGLSCCFAWPSDLAIVPAFALIGAGIFLGYYTSSEWAKGRFDYEERVAAPIAPLVHSSSDLDSIDSVPPQEAEEIETVTGPAWDKHRALVYDAKQDVLPILYGMQGVDCPICTLNPFDNRCAAWDMARDITAPVTAQQFASILIPDNQNVSQPFFNDAARNLLTNVLIALMKKAGEHWEFRDVILALKSRKNIVALLGDDPLVEQYLPVDQHGRDTITGHSVMGTLATKMAPFEFVAAAWSQAKSKVSLKHWLQNEYIIVLGNDEANRSALDAINRVIFKRISELVLAGAETETSRTWIFLDEAREAGKLEGLSSLMTKGRSKGAAVVLGFQDIEGMRDSFGTQGANEIVGMCANKAVLRLESPETAKWASEVFGEFEAFEDKQGWSTGSGETVGEATTEGNSATRGTGTSQTKSINDSGGAVSSGAKYSMSENESETRNSSRSTNASQSRNWNETLNRERVRRTLILPSQFQSLPATTPQNGLTGYFASPFTGAYEGHIPGEQLGKQLNPPNPSIQNVAPRPDSHQYIRPWDAVDFKRLKIQRAESDAPPKATAPPQSAVPVNEGDWVSDFQDPYEDEQPPDEQGQPRL